MQRPLIGWCTLNCASVVTKPLSMLRGLFETFVKKKCRAHLWFGGFGAEPIQAHSLANPRLLGPLKERRFVLCKKKNLAPRRVPFASGLPMACPAALSTPAMEPAALTDAIARASFAMVASPVALHRADIPHNSPTGSTGRAH
jgi:hypothetical protein